MLRDEAVAQVKEGLGFREDLDDPIVQRMKRVQRLLEMGRSLPWFLRSLLDVDVEVNVNITIPVDFIREVRDPTDWGIAIIDPANTNYPTKLIKMDELEAVKKYGVGDGSSAPQAYYLSPGEIVLAPRNHTAVTIRVEHYKRALVLDTNIENLWLKYVPDLIIGNAGASMAKTLQDQAAYDEFSQLASLAWSAIFAESVERKVGGRQYILGRNT